MLRKQVIFCGVLQFDALLCVEKPVLGFNIGALPVQSYSVTSGNSELVYLPCTFHIT